MRHLLRSQVSLRLIEVVVFALLLAAGVSCNAPAVGSPFVPIPPPNPTFGPPTPELDSDGVTRTYWKVTSPPSPQLSDFWVYLTNINMDEGTIERAAQDGSYETRIEGQQDNQIRFTFGSPDGETMCWPLREGLAEVPCPGWSP
jgi:hypothetical protein